MGVDGRLASGHGSGSKARGGAERRGRRALMATADHGGHHRVMQIRDEEGLARPGREQRASEP
jgi:hypothetical protein